MVDFAHVLCTAPALAQLTLSPPLHCSALFDTWKAQPRFLAEYFPVLLSTCSGLILIAVLQCLWLHPIFK